MKICDICRRDTETETDVSVAISVSSRYGPGEGRITICSNCFEMVNFIWNFSVGFDNSEDLKDVYGSLLDLLLTLRTHFEEVLT